MGIKYHEVSRSYQAYFTSYVCFWESGAFILGLRVPHPDPIHIPYLFISVPSFRRQLPTTDAASDPDGCSRGVYGPVHDLPWRLRSRVCLLGGRIAAFGFGFYPYVASTSAAGAVLSSLEACW